MQANPKRAAKAAGFLRSLRQKRKVTGRDKARVSRLLRWLEKKQPKKSA